ncbi:MAG: RNA polymerase sigma factor, partial [Planctomycetota bacterium]
MHSDEELLQHGSFLRGIASALLRGEPDVEDVVQETYLAALRHRPQRARPWMGRVARNLALRRHRTSARVLRREHAAARPEAVPAEDAVEQLEIQRKVVEAVLALEEPYRSTIVRRYFDGLAPKEIARRSGVPYETVRTRLGRALRDLRRRLDGEHAGWAFVLAPLIHPGPKSAIVGGVLMSAKQKTLLVVLPFLGLAVGVAGQMVLADRTGGRAARGYEVPRVSSGDVSKLRAEVASLRQEVETLRAETRAGGGGATGPGAGDARAARAREILDQLLAIEQGERQLAIKKAFEELSACGDSIVPDILALLQAGRDQDYGGALSFAGNMVRGYPRLRTVLIDVLRQVGTPQAKDGLLAVLRGSDDLLDYRDVLLLYGTTADERLVTEVSELIPKMLRSAEQAGGDQARTLDMYVTRWIGKHNPAGSADLLAKLAL